MEPPVTIIKTVSMGWADDMEHSVSQHIVEGIAHLQDGFLGGELSHTKQGAHITESYRHGQFEQGQVGRSGHMTVPWSFR